MDREKLIFSFSVTWLLQLEKKYELAEKLMQEKYIWYFTVIWMCSSDEMRDKEVTSRQWKFYMDLICHALLFFFIFIWMMLVNRFNSSNRDNPVAILHKLQWFGPWHFYVEKRLPIIRTDLLYIIWFDLFQKDGNQNNNINNNIIVDNCVKVFLNVISLHKKKIL